MNHDAEYDRRTDDAMDAAKDAELETRIAAAERIHALVAAHGREIAALRSAIEAAFAKPCQDCGAPALDGDMPYVCPECKEPLCMACTDDVFPNHCRTCAQGLV